MAIKIRRGLDADRLSVIFEEGEIVYTTDTKSFFIGDGVTAGGNQIGGTTAAELLKTEVHNATGSTLTAGQVVYLSGNTGNKPNAVLAQANSEATSSKTIGLVITDIANNANGYIATDGLLGDLNTSMFAPGDMLWLSDSISGGVTTIVPDTPNHAVFIGYVVSAHPTQGKILIHIQNGYELNELHDVKITSVADGESLTYSSSLGYWKNTLIDKTSIGLGNVDNTSDANKPISTATQTALNNKQDSLGFTPVTNARTLTINGTTFDLSANRTWSVGDLVSTGSYSNPTWLTSLAWGKLTGTPTTLSGYGITDAVPSNRTLTINGVAQDLSADRSWTISFATPTLAQVTTVGNTTTNAISVGGLTVATNLIYTDTVNGRVGIGTTTPSKALTVNGDVSIPNNASYFTKSTSGSELSVFKADTSNNIQIGSIFFGGNQINYTAINFDWYQYPSSVLTQRMRLWGTTGNLTIQNGGTFTDAGFRLDVNGTARIQNQLTTIGSITAASLLARGVYFNNTLVAAANNDVLVGLDINPTFTNGAFTGVSNIGVRVQKGTLRLASISADPTTAANGDMYYNTTNNTFKVYQGGAWKTITAI